MPLSLPIQEKAKTKNSKMFNGEIVLTILLQGRINSYGVRVIVAY